MLNNKINKRMLILAAVIFVQCIYITLMFGINKQGFHSDELWNYGFANSTAGTHIFKEDIGDVPKNTDSWQSSQLLRDYITVDKSEIFNYSAIYYNATQDYNPPLGYMMLHFICAMFPGKWSKWYCFALNIICFVIMQIYIYKLTKSLTKDENAGIIACFFFGFTMAAQNITIFLRIYSPATMFGIMLIYYAHELYANCNSEKNCRYIYIKMFVVNLLGCFTVHFFLPFAFIVTLMYCLYYLFSKRFKRFLVYGITMAVSVGMSIAIFPATIRHMFGDSQYYSSMSYSYKQYPAMWQNKMYWSYMTNDLFGIHNSIWETMTGVYALYAAGIILFITVPLCFVFRNEKWLKSIFSKVKKIVLDIAKGIKNLQYTLVVLITTVIFVILIAAFKTSVYSMGRTCTRYIFMVYPVMAVFAVTAVWYIITYFIKRENLRNIIGVAVSAVFIVLSIALASDAYYFKHQEEGVTLTKIENNANCIIVTNEPWTLTCYTCELYNTQHYYLADYESALKDNYNSDSVNKNDPLYLILDVSMMDGNDRMINLFGTTVFDDRKYTKDYKSSDYEEFFSGIDGADKAEYVGCDSVFGRDVKIYRLN